MTSPPVISPGPSISQDLGQVASLFSVLQAHLAYLDADQQAQLHQAYLFAEKSHRGQTRNNGQPYITHPVAVATQCAQWHLDLPTLMAALLHDVMEDCHVPRKTLSELFGPTVAQLVDGLTKLDKLASRHPPLPYSELESGVQKGPGHNQAESFRKMLLAMAEDWRIILIKLADRSHNIQTLHELPRHKWKRIAHETLDIYAPIAYRLGLWPTYVLLQEYAFKHAFPWRHRVLEAAQQKLRTKQAARLKKIVRHVQADLLAHPTLQAQVYSREKSLYAIYKKMTQKHRRFSQITDVYSLRIVVNDSLACYAALGLVHQRYRPVPGRFKDHIALTQRNGYQALHTTVLDPSGAHLEFQIRTEYMDHIAQKGLAAHWQYKVAQTHSAHPNQVDQVTPTAQAVQKIHSPSFMPQGGWLQSLLDIQHETPDAQEFLEHIKVDLSPDAMYVLTPKGQIMALPKGACVIDFAYALHTSLGDHMVGARVNGHTVKCSYIPRSGDVIDVLTNPKTSPQPIWLAWVRTGRARSRIRHYLKTLSPQTMSHIGEQLLHKACQREGLTHWPPQTAQGHSLWPRLLQWSGVNNLAQLWLELGLGKRQASVLAKRLNAWTMEEEGLPPTYKPVGSPSLLDGSSAQSGDLPIKPPSLSQERQPIGISISHFHSPQTATHTDWVWATCCQPLPGEAITAYLGHGEQLEIHRKDCDDIQNLHPKQADRFLAATWVEEEGNRITSPASQSSPSQPQSQSWACHLTVNVRNETGALAQVTTALTAAQTQILHIDMGQELAQSDQATLRFIVTVQDTFHWQRLVNKLEETPCVLSVRRGHCKRMVSSCSPSGVKAT
jgi:guanosine-3',5'-bis(diphosphate) 3'-pyrophosphohydrolase